MVFKVVERSLVVNESQQSQHCQLYIIWLLSEFHEKKYMKIIWKLLFSSVTVVNVKIYCVNSPAPDKLKDMAL